MEKYKRLKFAHRYFLPRNFRCHKRRVFFENLFSDLKKVKDKSGNYVVQYDESSFRRACHEMAARISFYPFEKRSCINVGEFFNEQRSQPLYTQLEVEIIRTSPVLNFIFGNYEVHVYGFDKEKRPINFTYRKVLFIL